MNGMPRLPRQTLPRELTDPQTDLGRLVVLTGDLTAGTQLRRAVAGKTIDFIQKACPHYKMSHTDDLLCRSGEETGRAYRGRNCSECTVGQFSASMLFLGEIHEPDPAQL